MIDVQVSKDGVVRVGQIWQDKLFGYPVISSTSRIFKIKSFSVGPGFEYVNAEIIGPGRQPQTGVFYSAGDQSYIKVEKFSGVDAQYILRHDVIVQPEEPIKIEVGQLWQDKTGISPQTMRIDRIHQGSYNGLWYAHVTVTNSGYHPVSKKWMTLGRKGSITFEHLRKSYSLVVSKVAPIPPVPNAFTAAAVRNAEAAKAYWNQNNNLPEPPSPATFFNQFIAFLDKERPDWKSYPNARIARIHQSFLAGFNAGAKR